MTFASRLESVNGSLPNGGSRFSLLVPEVKPFK